MSEPVFDDVPICLDGGAVADSDGVCVEHKRAGCVGPLPVRLIVAAAEVSVPHDGGHEYARLLTLAPVARHVDPRPPLSLGACFTTTLREPTGDSRIERSVDYASAMRLHRLLRAELRARDEQ